MRIHRVAQDGPFLFCEKCLYGAGGDFWAPGEVVAFEDYAFVPAHLGGVYRSKIEVNGIVEVDDGSRESRN